MGERVRVLHVSEASWGGVVSLIREFTAQQVARGHQVGLLSPPIAPAIDGVDCRSWSISRRRIDTYPLAVRELKRAIHEFEPDVVHLHSFMAGFIGRLPLTTGLLPVVYQPHAWAFNVSESRSLRRAVVAWERFAGRRTKVLVVNCQDACFRGRPRQGRQPHVLVLHWPITTADPCDSCRRCRRRLRRGSSWR